MLKKRVLKLSMAMVIAVLFIYVIYDPIPKTGGEQFSQNITEKYGENGIGLVALNTGEIYDFRILDPDGGGYVRFTSFNVRDCSASIICYPNERVIVDATVKGIAEYDQVRKHFGLNYANSFSDGPSIALVDFYDGTIHKIGPYQQKLHDYTIITTRSQEEINIVCHYKLDAKPWLVNYH